MDQLQEDILSNEQDLDISGEAGNYLVEAGKWAKFIAVTFFVLTGLCALVLLFYGNALDNLGVNIFGGSGAGGVIIFVFLIAIAIVVVTYYFLVVFANKIQSGILAEDIEQVNNGLNALRIHFVIIGILSGLSLLISLATLF